MANICENKMYVYSQDSANIKHLRAWCKENLDGSLELIDDECFEYYFDSRWDFPEQEMIEMVDELPNKDDIYIRVLSVEEAGCYCAFHVYEGGEWELQ
jgi:hypothetical protein